MDFLFGLCVKKVLIANVMMLMETCWKEEVDLLLLNHLEYQEGKEGSW